MTEPEKNEKSQDSPKAGEEGQADKAAEEKAKTEAEQAKTEAEKAKPEAEKAKAEAEQKKAEEEKKNWWPKRQRKAYLVALAIVILDVLAVALGTILEAVPMAFSIGCVGIVTFIGTLTLSNYLSDVPNLAKNEMRKAIAAAFTVVYLVFLGFVIFDPAASTAADGATRAVTYDTELAKTIVGHFTWIEGIVIGFYFGSRILDRYKESQDAGKNSESGNK